MNGKMSDFQLRVRVGQGRNARFNSLHGQNNAELIAGPLTPLVRVNRRFDAFT